MTSTPTADAPSRFSILAGTLVLLALGAFAWRYYLERTACFDSAFFSWLMIDGAVPVSVLGRYGSWIAQLLPVAAVHAGASLDLVLRSYSLAFILFHGLVFYLLAFRLRDARATMVLPIVLTAGFHYMFYYGISELYQGLSLSVLLWVLVRRSFDPVRRGSLLWPVLAMLVNAWASFYHQLLVLPLLFILVYEVNTGLWKDKRAWALALVLLAWYVVRIKGMSSSSYEQARMPTISDLLTYTTRLRELPSTAYFLMVWSKLKALGILAVVAGFLAVRDRAWWRLLCCLAFSAAFLLLILIVDRDGMAPVIYENYYPVFGLPWAMLLVNGMSDPGMRKRVVQVTLCAVCLLGLLQIHRAHYRMTEHVSYWKRITTYQAELGHRKSLVGFKNFPWYYGLVHWPAAMESALCSAVQGPEYAATCFVSDDMALLDTVSGVPDRFLGPSWEPLWFGIPSLDQRYFPLPADVGYAWANSAASFDPAQISMVPPSGVQRMVPDRFTVIPVEIRNTGSTSLPSIDAAGAPIHFDYRLFREDGSLYQDGGLHSALETDIAPGTGYYQGLVVERPVERGKYTVRAQLVADGAPWGPEVEIRILADAWPL